MRLGLAILLFCGLLSACDESPQLAEARRLQSDIKRAIITTKNLGRFGALALFQEDVQPMPCTVPLSPTQRVCEVKLVGRGIVRVGLAVPALNDAGRVQADAALWIRYPANCEDQAFDFKSIDHALPRLPSPSADLASWQDKLVRVTWRRDSGQEGPRCSMLVEVAPALLERLGAGLALDGGLGPPPG